MGVNRANLQTMLTGFSDAFDSLYEEMKHQQKLTERKLLNFFRVTTAWREKVFLFLLRGSYSISSACGKWCFSCVY